MSMICMMVHTEKLRENPRCIRRMPINWGINSILFLFQQMEGLHCYSLPLWILLAEHDSGVWVVDGGNELLFSIMTAVRHGKIALP
jgi:hypothetical protein